MEMVRVNCKCFLCDDPQQYIHIRDYYLFFSANRGSDSLVCSFAVSFRGRVSLRSHISTGKNIHLDLHPREWCVFYRVSAFVFLFQSHKNMPSKKQLILIKISHVNPNFTWEIFNQFYKSKMNFLSETLNKINRNNIIFFCHCINSQIFKYYFYEMFLNIVCAHFIYFSPIADIL